MTGQSEREGTAGALRIGIDLGGTKTEVAVLDPAGGFLLRRRAATPRNDYRATVATIAQLVTDAETSVGANCTVGVGIPGAISPATGLVKNANSSWLNGQPLLEDLQAALSRSVRIQNDANCLAMSEAADGAAAGAPVVLGVILGTGVGAGICIDGQVLTGRNAIAGEWGHNPLPPALPDADSTAPVRCWCGRWGCIETWLSGPALARQFAQHDAPGAERAGPVDARAVFQLADEGDAGAVVVVERWLDRLARSLAGVINVLDPDVIVLGGGLSNVEMIYRELPRRWGVHVFSDRVDTTVCPAAHGDSSGVRGAAWLWPPVTGLE
ncbi:MAG TPA: ROK family protein [Lautropia sp.]|nr:ROK family protein [Lautropia sp.]